MPKLRKERIDIPLGGGRSENVDERVADAPYVKTANNASFHKQGGYVKRRGFESVSSTSLPTTPLSLNSVHSWRGNPIAYGTDGLYQYSSTLSTWYNPKTGVPPVEYEVISRAADFDDIIDYDSTHHNNTYLIETWALREAGNIYYRVTIMGEETVIQRGKFVAAGTMPYVVNINGTISIFYIDTSNVLKRSTLNTTTWVWNTASTIASNVSYYDVSGFSADTHGAVVYNDTTGGPSVHFAKLSASGIQTPLTLTSAYDDTLRVHFDATSEEALVVQGDIGGTGATHTIDLEEVDASTNPPTSNATSTGWWSKTGIAISNDDWYGPAVVAGRTTGGRWLVAAAITVGESELLSNVYQTYYRHDILTTGTLATYGDSFYAVGMTPVGRCHNPDNMNVVWSVERRPYMRITLTGFTDGPKKVHVPNQGLCVLMLDEDSVTPEDDQGGGTNVAAYPIVIGRFNHEVTAQMRMCSRGWMPHNDEVEADKWNYPSTVITNLESAYHLGITESREGFIPNYEEKDRVSQARTDGRTFTLNYLPPPVRSLNTGDGTLINQGGMLCVFDGDTLGENTPHYAPTLKMEIDTGTPKTLDTVQRVFRVRMVVKDQNGDRHESPISSDWLIDMPTASSVKGLTFVVDYPDLTNYRENSSSKYYIEVYSTADGDKVHENPMYWCLDVPVTKNADGFFVSELRTDPELSGGTDIDDPTTRRPLAEDTGKLFNSATPPFRDIAYGASRVYGISAENPHEVWQSLLPEVFSATQWNPALLFGVNPHTELTSLAFLDEKIILFTEDEIYVTRPSDRGNDGVGTDFTPQIITSDTGCINRLSIATTPQGVVFQGKRGIYLLDRSLQVQFISGAIEDTIENASINSAVVVPFDQEVRFGTDADETFIYHYPSGNWASRPSDDRMVHAAMVDTKYYQAINTPLGWAISSERTTSDTNFDDNGEISSTQIDNDLEITTNWFKPSGLQGFQRIWHVGVAGKFISHGTGYTNPSKLRIYLAYDNDDTWVDTYDLTLPAEGEPFYLKVKPSRQKCTSIRVGIFEVSATTLEGNSVHGEGCHLSGVSLEVGLFPGGHRYETAGMRA